MSDTNSKSSDVWSDDSAKHISRPVINKAIAKIVCKGFYKIIFLYTTI